MTEAVDSLLHLSKSRHSPSCVQPLKRSESRGGWMLLRRLGLRRRLCHGSASGSARASAVAPGLRSDWVGSGCWIGKFMLGHSE